MTFTAKDSFALKILRITKLLSFHDCAQKNFLNVCHNSKIAYRLPLKKSILFK